MILLFYCPCLCCLFLWECAVFVRGSESVQIFLIVCSYLYCHWRFNYQEGEGWRFNYQEWEDSDPIKRGRTEIPSRGGGLRSHQEGRTEIPLTRLTLPHFCAWIYKDIFVYISIAVGDPVIIRGWMGLTPPYFYACPKPEPEFPSILLLIITALKKMFITKRNFIKHTTKQFCLDIVCWDDP